MSSFKSRSSRKIQLSKIHFSCFLVLEFWSNALINIVSKKWGFSFSFLVLGLGLARWKGQQTHSLNYTHIHILLHTDCQESKKRSPSPKCELKNVIILRVPVLKAPELPLTPEHCSVGLRDNFERHLSPNRFTRATEPIHRGKPFKLAVTYNTIGLKGRNICSKFEVCERWGQKMAKKPS